jgi:hypothetical protein
MNYDEANKMFESGHSKARLFLELAIDNPDGPLHNEMKQATIDALDFPEDMWDALYDEDMKNDGFITED